MKKILKNVLKYTIIFIIVLIICVTSLVVTSMIPREKIQENLEESAEFYKTVQGIHRTNPKYQYSYIYYSNDTIILSIIYAIDSLHPLSSSLNEKYYQGIWADINDNYIRLIEEDLQPDLEYMRYWHGSMTILRPLLTIFNIQQIYLINTITMWALIIILTIILFRKSKKLAVMFILGLIAIVIPYASSCFMYIWTTNLMFIVSIIAILIEKKHPKLLGPLFLITGMLTCYLDGLTTELSTILLPLLLVSIIRYEDQRIENLKQGLKFIVNSLLLWGFGYFGMWIAKWTLASIVLNINAMDYVFDKAMIRVNAPVANMKGLYLSWRGILLNIKDLFPLALAEKKYYLWLIGIIVALFIYEIVVVDVKKIKKMWFSVILLSISTLPYIRYAILANHAYRHAFFTFRMQIVTIIATLYICINSLEARRKWIKKRKE